MARGSLVGVTTAETATLPSADADLAKDPEEEVAHAAMSEAQGFVRRLLSFLEPRMLRRLKHSVTKELPPKITRKVP